MAARSLLLSLVLISVGASPASAARRCQDSLAFEKEQVRNTVINNEFRVTRTLTQAEADRVPGGEASYETLAGTGFLPALEQAAKEVGLWVDIGAGEGNALAGALDSARFAGLRGFGVAPYSPVHVVEKLKGLIEAHPSRLRVEHKLLSEVAAELRGKARVATDIYGALSYVDDFDRTLAQALDSLVIGGDLFFVLQKFLTNANHFTRIKNAAGEFVPMIDFLRRIQGIEVVATQETAPRSVLFHLRRTGEKIEVPKLKLIELDADKTPPRRIYRLVN